MTAAVGRAGETAPTLVFDGKKYRVGMAYRYDELPAAVRRDVLAQEEDLESLYGRDPRALQFRLVVVPHADLMRALASRYGPGLDQALADPGTARLARSIERRGLQHPPVGEEGWTRALALASLGRDMPYFEILAPIGAPGIPEFIPTLEGPPKEEAAGGDIPPSMAREMREGFWRMLQRVHLGIPGFVGTGRVEHGQFTGGLAGMQTAWLVRPHGMGFADAVPVVGFYLWGSFWPKILGIAMKGVPGKSKDLAERLEAEFGRTPEYELLRGTIPLPMWESDPFLGASSDAPTRVKPWVRCGNTMFWRWTQEPGREVWINPVDLVVLDSRPDPEGVPLGAILVVRRAFPEESLRTWTSEEFSAAMNAVPALLGGAVAVWLTRMFQAEDAGRPRREIVDLFVKQLAGRRNAVLSGIEALFDSGAVPTAQWRRLVLAEGSPAHAAAAEAEKSVAATDLSVVAADFAQGLDEALADFGVMEC